MRRVPGLSPRELRRLLADLQGASASEVSDVERAPALAKRDAGVLPPPKAARSAGSVAPLPASPIRRRDWHPAGHGPADGICARLVLRRAWRLRMRPFAVREGALFAGFARRAAAPDQKQRMAGHARCRSGIPVLQLVRCGVLGAAQPELGFARVAAGKAHQIRGGARHPQLGRSEKSARQRPPLLRLLSPPPAERAADLCGSSAGGQDVRFHQPAAGRSRRSRRCAQGQHGDFLLDQQHASRFARGEFWRFAHQEPWSSNCCKSSPSCASLQRCRPSPACAAGWARTRKRCGAAQDKRLRADLAKSLGKAEASSADWLAASDKAAQLPADSPQAKLLVHAAAVYLAKTLVDERPADPVARFHLGNGARIERLNWAGDTSTKGVKQSYGLMVTTSSHRT
ncbi:hypothetical protein FQA39_LY19275 [Lamprigera yunnana]|nr:hypothetical protein FQA39_LY19275 [Lamprigera yunnana]